MTFGRVFEQSDVGDVGGDQHFLADKRKVL